MGHELMFLVLTLLVVNAVSKSPACSMDRCHCYSKPYSSHPYVECFIPSITSWDATIRSLPTDIQLLALQCENPESLSVLNPGIFEKFSQLRTLSINYCNISVLTATSFRGLSFLENLLFLNNTLPPLSADTFLYLSDMNILEMIECNLTTLPDISHLKSLQYLNVSQNNLREIEFEARVYTDNITQTDFLNNLIIVDVSYNNISAIPLDLITRAPRLYTLVLTALPLTGLVIPENVQLRYLEILVVDDSPLLFVDIPGLYLATGIRLLFLEGTGRPLHLPGLPHLVSLEELSLTNFAITDTIWQQLNSSHLARLTLTKNRLTTINISHLPALWELVVTGNNISHLDDKTFYNQTNLLVVKLSHNILTELSVGIFNNSVTIKHLDLSANNISILQTDVFKGLHELENLDLSYNAISSVPHNVFRDLSAMKRLYISSNSLTLLPNFSALKNLFYIDVSFNKIAVIFPSDLSELPNLQFLLIGNNRLKTLPTNLLSPCPKVLVAWFNHNDITALGTFGDHPSLSILRLDHNQITNFLTESPFIRLQRLEQLFLNSNNLTTINNNMFPPNLQILILDDNFFENVNKASFSYLRHLKVLSLSMNKRSLSMPSSAFSVFRDFSHQPTMDIEGNLFLCDCNMGYLKEFLENGYLIPVFNHSYPLFIGLRRTKCYTPFEGGTIRPFMDVPLSHFACEYNVTWCDDICHCCSDAPKCECALSCPSECKCYYGGSGLKKFYIHIHCRSQNLEQIPNGIPARTVVLYLDGNNLSHLSKQDFSHLQDAEDIYLNSSYIQSADNGTFENISALKSLSLNDNQLTSIDDNFLGRLPSVKQIYLHNNLIDTISLEAFSQLSSVETITLHNNRLMFLKAVLKIPHPMYLTLAGNPWSCNCDVSKVLMRTFYEIKASIADNEELCCSFQESSFLSDQDSAGRTLSSTNRNGTSFVSNPTEYMGDNYRVFPHQDINLTSSDFSSSCLPLSDFSHQNNCRTSGSGSTALRSASTSSFHPGFIALIAITVILLLIAVAVVVVLVKRKELQALVFVKLGVRILDQKVHLDKKDSDQKVFDAFISYSSKDEVFVATTLAPMLEENKYRLCVHYRDFPVGRDITETIYRAIQNSSRTILLLSMNFLSSEWCRFEFQTAHHHVLREGSHRLIVVILGDVPEEEMDPDLKVHVQSRTYLKYGDRWFWEKLFFAMPSIKGRQVNNGDQRAYILQRMEVLAQDEIVDREINLTGQQHNPQDEIVDHEINFPGQQHNPQTEFVDDETNLPEQQHNPHETGDNNLHILQEKQAVVAYINKRNAHLEPRDCFA